MAATIRSENLTQLAAQLLAAGQRVIAPARVEQQIVYKALTSASEMLPEAEYILPDASFKEFLFPRTEPVLRYRYGPDGKVETQTPDVDAEPAQVILGARPCDAASLPILDKIFSWDYIDPFYFKRRAKTTIVTIACSRQHPRCFCTSVDCGPDCSDGSDLRLTKSGASYLAEAITASGEALITKYAALFEHAAATPAAEVATLAPAFNLEAIKPWLDSNFDDPLWLEVAAKCIGCGTCAYGCPTCHCFDIVDEGDCQEGCRIKNWDTCASALFTLHSSGHNPRHSQPQRFRQRVMHKFKYYLDKFEKRGCVGCGRCALRCPVGVDLLDVLQTLTQRQA